MMKLRFARLSGQTLTEVMLAAIFLATGGLVIYQTSVNMMKNESWKADRVFAQGALRDMVEVFSTFDYCELQHTVAKKIDINTSDEAVIQQALADDSLQQSFEADSTPMPPLKFESFFVMGDKDKPVVKTKDEMLADPIYKAYVDTKARMNLRRAVVFKDENLTRAIVVCVVKFTATDGHPVIMKMPFVTFNTLAPDPCPTP